MVKSVSIIGGDLRLVFLAKLWQTKDVKVYTYGLENSILFQNDINLNQFENIEKCETIKQCVQSSNIIISSMPFSKDNIFVNGVFSKSKIKIEEIAKYLENKTFIAGKISDEFYKLIKNKNVKIIDLMKNEYLAILNSISTAEGAIKIAIEETNCTIHGSNILILGFGRIGKVLAKMLEGFGANIFCEARKKEDLAWIESFGYNKVPLENLNNNLENYDIIFNTIPNIILDEKKLRLLKKDAVIIDLASSPGGVDREASELLGIKTIWALALPGKLAPKSAAEIIKQTIEKELNI